MEKSYLASLNRGILDTQAELDDIDMFGGSHEKEAYLRIQLAELQDEKARILARDETAKAIVLETGEVFPETSQGGWGRLHYVSRVIGPRKHRRDFWICGHCRNRIGKGAEHYRRNYYANKTDCRTGRQIRLCLECYEEHAEQHPPSTTFPVCRPARRKVA